MTRQLPTVLVDTREPHLDAGDAEDATFTPCVFAPGQQRDLPFADRRRVALPSERIGLPEGDYAPKGLRGVVAVERKSGLDLLATIFGDSGVDALGEQMANLDRFREELRRVQAARYELFVIVSEESRGWYFTEARHRWQRYDKAFDPFRLFDIIDSFLVDCGVPTLYAGSKALAELQVGGILARASGWLEGGKSWDEKAIERGVAPRWWTPGEKARAARDRGVALPWMREQVKAGAEEASDGRRTQEGTGGCEGDAGGISGDGVVPVQAMRQGIHGVAASGGPHPLSRLPAAVPIDLSGGDVAAATGEAVAHDAGEQGAEAGADGALREGDGGCGRQATPKTAASEGATGAGLVDPVSPGEHGGRSVRGLPRDSEVGESRDRTSDPGAPVAEPPCACGTPAQPSPHLRAAPGCCYSATPQPAPVAGSQTRISLSGAQRCAIKSSGGTAARPLWRVRLNGCPMDGWNSSAIILREWPVLCDPAAPWVRQAAPPDARVTEILAGRAPLLGVADSYSEHAAAAQRKRAGRPVAKARRGREGA